MLNYRNEEVILSSDRITYLIKHFGPMERYLWFKIFLLFFLVIYLQSQVYNKVA